MCVWCRSYLLSFFDWYFCSCDCFLLEMSQRVWFSAWILHRVPKLYSCVRDSHHTNISLLLLFHFLYSLWEFLSALRFEKGILDQEFMSTMCKRVCYCMNWKYAKVSSVEHGEVVQVVFLLLFTVTEPFNLPPYSENQNVITANRSTMIYDACFRVGGQGFPTYKSPSLFQSQRFES